MSTLVVVDGANVVNEVGRYLTDTVPSTVEAELQTRYYREWFDIDRLVNATLGESLRLDPFRDLGVVLFHSLRGLGSLGSPCCMQGEAAPAFWGRQGANPNTSTSLVQVPGPKEKGVDTAIVVYLFETIESWDSAVIFSNDADFVPAVGALRRRGKRVYCAANPSERGSPLVQASQHFMPWDLEFLRADRALFEFLQPSAGLDTFLGMPVARPSPEAVTFNGAGLQIHGIAGGNAQNGLNEILRNVELYAMETGQALSVQARVLPQSRGPQFLAAGSHVFEAARRHHAGCSAARWYSFARP